MNSAETNTFKRQRKSMMFRDRTNLFLSYRRTFPHNARFSIRSNDGKTNPFLDEVEDEEAFPMVDMSDANKGDVLPPRFVDLTQEVVDNLDQVERLMKQLNGLYRKNSLPGFEDKSHDEKEIEQLSYQIIQLFQRCYNVIKKLQHIFDSQTMDGKRLQRGELIILDNMRKRYAQQIQSESNKFRVLQNNYLKFLNKDDLKPIFPKNDDPSQLLIEEEETATKGSQDIEAYSRQTLRRQMDNKQQTNQRFLQERDEEITQLAKGVLEVSTIFREMQNLIIDQGTIVDRIDYNIENTVIHLKGANRELDKATHYQKRSQKCRLILLLSLCVIALFFIVMLKPHSSGGNHSSSPATTSPGDSTTRPENMDPVGVTDDKLQKRFIDIVIK
ncbi:hypothetical protein HG536_0F02570 [Torulaspora globosa]|uniref:t-SNARE coiled-coil homology domain-containing protein n=1 Tax=Torulaspora globosa TaxID=48254 RepID=A0A7G3ZK96_9SACH|nr:uncharacterized protein HG536_0F02570 [Torulaspora globosa]QLL33932.1 hypothetical protein HG536_0F02570 [Torulaspora globosa]